MAAATLAVVLYGRPIATVEQTSHGQRRLEYLPDPGPTPLSLSMPLNQHAHTHRTIDPYLLGLLPDREEVRISMGQEFGINGRNPFLLLTRIGLDCAGAVQFCDPDIMDRVLAREGSLEPLTEAQIGAHIAALSANSERSWVASNERWSLAGAQAKFALHRAASGDWAEAHGATPTTHIIKPGIADLADQALNEHVCMDAARRVGLRSARSEYTEFDGRPAIVVERYDRRRASGSDDVVRIHQEDMCQALSVLPDRKYESDGGPSASRILSLLGVHSGTDAKYQFVQFLAYNYLIGGSDAHAKNFSLLMVGDQVRLAPLYDVASAFPYEDMSQELTMAVSGERRFGRVSDQHWASLAGKAGLEPGRVVEQVHDLARKVPDAMADAFSAAAQAGADTEQLRDRMLPAMEEQARSALRFTR